MNILHDLLPGGFALFLLVLWGAGWFKRAVERDTMNEAEHNLAADKRRFEEIEQRVARVQCAGCTSPRRPGAQFCPRCGRSGA